ncbi:DUF4145 domain-containing protein [Pseudomonas fluorescens]|uniref:DUF4145 domain-containing protein n=1 Tax=Pseudomonas fluorescens TaxID=294 RepID=UPI00209B7C50|nr:DUF4145 domain-containing protein [Pseudomonas fluorescens]MCO7626414.1 DUF4145 domain-containing protein [Pseudomonas fluorescens]
MKKTFKAHCPRCDGERICWIHGEFEKPWDWDDGQHSMWGQSDYKLAQCCGCEEVFFHESSWDSEDRDYEYDPKTSQEVAVFPRTITTFPAPKKESKQPDWVWDIAKIDPQLFTILSEMYQAYEHGAFILASVGLRTAFDRTTEVLKIDPELTLKEKVALLLNDGYIGDTESQTLGVVTDAGSAAAHRAWTPTQKEFETLLKTLELFIQHTVVSGKSALNVADSIPKRPPKKQKPNKKSNE